MTGSERLSRVIAEALSREPYEPEAVLSKLCNDADLRQTFAAQNSTKHPYSLYDHTRMVCHVYERQLRQCVLPQSLRVPSFRLLLCLHDLGKPRALAEHQKHLQHAFTARRLGELAQSLPVGSAELLTMQALVSDDALGLYIRAKVSQEEAVARITRMALHASHVPACQFFDLLTLLYQCDAAAYTRAAFLLDPSDFVAKPKLERTFQQTEKGLIFSSAANRLLFSHEVEMLYTSLRAVFCGHDADLPPSDFRLI